MEYRVYILNMGNVSTGYVDKETLAEVRNYQSFFADNDNHGTGFFEIELPSLNSGGESVYLRATSEEMRFGSHSPEGWNPVRGDTVSKNGCSVLFDDMLVYYAYEDIIHKNQNVHLSKKEIEDSLHEEDTDIFTEVFERYKSEKQ